MKMFNNYSNKVIILSAICLSAINPCLAESLPSAFSPLKTLDLDKAPSARSELVIDLNKTNESSKLINLNGNDTVIDFAGATDKFVQCNIKASWEDFKTLIKTDSDNDFVYINLANKMADLGFFDLANQASSKIKDKDIASISLDAMKRYYFPRKKLRLEDEMLIAEK